MSVRWRKDGALECAAMRPELPGDTYICDRLHYELSVIQGVLIADPDHEENALWHWRMEAVDAAVHALDTMSVEDPERTHGQADEILLSMVPHEVAEAYRHLMERAPWWA